MCGFVSSAADVGVMRKKKLGMIVIIDTMSTVTLFYQLYFYHLSPVDSLQCVTTMGTYDPSIVLKYRIDVLVISWSISILCYFQFPLTQIKIVYIVSH